ncbi:MAG: GntR family transcriptional regulator [bacterium]|nr:GntR family transcriptional regulator [bacterium]
MIVRIDSASPVPAFEQIRSQVATMIGSSILKTGTRLPTIRQLAKDLQVAPGTVARAYQELERTGAIVTKGRHGTLVAKAAAIERTEADIERAADELAVHAYQLGMTVDQLTEALRRAFQAVTAAT